MSSNQNPKNILNKIYSHNLPSKKTIITIIIAITAIIITILTAAIILAEINTIINNKQLILNILNILISITITIMLGIAFYMFSTYELT